jgi:hypothetical protein
MSKGQNRKMSFIESIASVTLGYILTVLIQYLIYPVFGINIPVKEAFAISLLIVLIAFVKNFAVRRFFNSLHVREVDL